MSANTKKWAIIGIIFAQCIWGLSFLFTKIALDTLRIEQLLAARFFVAALTLTFLWAFRVIKLSLTWKKLRLLLPVVIFQPILYFLFHAKGVQLTTSSEAAIVMALIPIVTFLIAWIMRQETPALGRWIAIVVSVAGVILITVARGVSGGSSIEGFLYLGGAVMLSSLFMVFSRRAALRVTPVETTFVMIWTGAIGFGGYLFLKSLIARELSTALSGMGSPMIIIGILYLGVLASVVGFFMINSALGHLEASKATAFTGITPVVAMAAGILFRGETLLPLQIVGAVFVLVGVFVAIRLERRQSKSPKT